MYNSSCIMLSASLWTGIDLMAGLEAEDLKNSGIEDNKHISILYADGLEIPRSGLKEQLESILGEGYWSDLTNLLKENDKMKVIDYFDLGKFENDSDYLVLLLRKDTQLSKMLTILNKGLSQLYGIKSDFATYNPHMTLAELEPGTAKKYVLKPLILRMIESAVFSLDDLVISYGQEGKDEYKEFNLTSWNAVDRYFRQREIEREKKFREELE